MSLNNVKTKELMYRLMISQLFYDGHKTMAVNLANIVKPHPACPPSDRLLNVVRMGIREEELITGKKELKPDPIAPGSGVDLEFETDVQTISPEPALYQTCYVTSHKGPCRVGAFHQSGLLVATGSHDTSIKILDVERMLAKSATPAEVIAQETPQQTMENHPVIRTLYDHNEEVTALDFHPVHQQLASGSKDFSIKFFDFSNPSVKKAYKSIQESSPVTCLSFHPSGDYILAGTETPTLRLYDVNTFQCFVAANPDDQHKKAVTGVSWSPNANLFVSCSEDGDIKIWDGVSNRVVNKFEAAHDGAEVCSVRWTRNSKYVLSCGLDSLVKLWELSTSRCLVAYTGAGATGRMEHRTTAVFNHTEDYVLFPDEKTISLCSWDSRNAERQKLLSLGHNGIVRTIVHSPTGPAFLTCSEDFRARFWFRKSSE
ncbi:cleavage stimulation factor subunit 1-like [Lineus longissimus]|uniref:cleavage stimulation factor subunit 1-like n=1 Tax=Lineus longissimus TaxID=88925 RepID=UPI002B4E9119